MPPKSGSPRATAHQLAVGADELDARRRRRPGTGCASPEPCVPVAQAPATEMCGSEPRLGSAQPCASQLERELAEAGAAADRDRARRRVDHGRDVEVGDADQVAVGVGDAVERVPGAERARSRGVLATRCCSSSTVVGRCRLPRGEGDVAGPVAHGHAPTTLVRGGVTPWRSRKCAPVVDAHRAVGVDVRAERGGAAASLELVAAAGVQRAQPRRPPGSPRSARSTSRDAAELDGQVARADLDPRPAGLDRQRRAARPGRLSANGVCAQPAGGAEARPRPPRPARGRPACSSIVRHTAATSRAPGRATRRISASAPTRSGKNCSPCWQVTASTLASGQRQRVGRAGEVARSRAAPCSARRRAAASIAALEVAGVDAADRADPPGDHARDGARSARHVDAPSSPGRGSSASTSSSAQGANRFGTSTET